MSDTRIFAECDYAKKGTQHGYLRVPHSSDDSAYGWIPVPIVCINGGGIGPTVLLVAGNHGDEYEGQLALAKLSRRLTHEDVRGRIIILPAANCPAVVAAKRTSPIDGGNLNRSFPGDPDGTPTQALAHYIENVLLAMADHVVDLHSGGRSLNYIPCALAREYSDADRMREAYKALDAFGAPISLIKDTPQGGDQTLLGGADRMGTHYLGTELGGAGAVSRAGLTAAEHGVARYLMAVGALDEPLTDRPAPRTAYFKVLGTDYYNYAEEEGVFEPAFDLGEDVEAGASAGAIHSPETPWREPQQVRFRVSGKVVCQRTPGRTRRGDCLFHLATLCGDQPEDVARAES